MKSKTLFILLIFSLTQLYPTVTFSQNKLQADYLKVGGFKLPDAGAGAFGTAPHVNEGSTFTNHIPYYAKFALWVGALNSKGESIVSAGTGNSVTARPEWTPDYKSLEKNENTGLANVEKVITTAYSDAIAFEGHIPLGLNIEQKIYGFVEKEFGIIAFDISLGMESEPLKEVYVGLWVDIDAAETETHISGNNDLLGFLKNGNAPFIFDSSRKGSNLPRLGMMILGTKTPIISWWSEKAYPETDAEQYKYLKGDVAFTNPDEPGDYRMLLSFGPISLKPGAKFQYPIVLIQSSDVNDFEASLNAAEDFYKNELGGISLKQSSTVDYQSTSAAEIPKAFQLNQNFPNPFNPETQIQFDLPKAAHVELHIYNILGQAVRTLSDGDYAAGTFSVIWNGSDNSGSQVPGGIYIYQIKAGDFQAQRKLIFLK